jgi:hypothetical protein
VNEARAYRGLGELMDPRRLRDALTSTRRAHQQQHHHCHHYPVSLPAHATLNHARSAVASCADGRRGLPACLRTRLRLHHLQQQNGMPPRRKSSSIRHHAHIIISIDRVRADMNGPYGSPGADPPRLEMDDQVGNSSLVVLQGAGGRSFPGEEGVGRLKSCAL